MIRARHGLAFTLLEAIIALILIAGVASVSLQLRAQSLRGRAAAAEATARQAALDDLLHQAVHGLLPNPQVPEDDAAPLAMRWTGRRAGHPYEVERALVAVPNPLAGEQRAGADPDAAPPQQIALVRWRATWRGETAEAWRAP